MGSRALTPALIARATRIKTLPLVLAPCGVGAAIALDRTGIFSWGRFLLTLAGAAAMHLGAMVINDVADARTGVDRMVRIDRAGIASDSGLLAEEVVSPGQMITLAASLYTVALGVGIVLAVMAGPRVLVFGVAGAVLGIFYAAPPIRYGYLGHGLGEVGVLVAYGLLPVAGSAYVQSGVVSTATLWAGLVPGLLTGLVFFHGNLLHWRADRAVSKRTLVVLLEPEDALLASGVVLTIAYTALVVQVIVGLFPATALIALVTALPLGQGWAKAFRDPLPQNGLAVLGANLGAAVLTGAVIAISLAV